MKTIALYLVAALMSLAGTALAERYSSQRSIRTGDSPARASRVVAGMRSGDALRFGGAPPGVSVSRTGPGSFRGDSPVASVRANISVRSDGRGGSIVTERTTSSSPFPGFGRAAGAIHGAATSLGKAYDASSRRTGR